jgi:hypothetical protein
VQFPGVGFVQFPARIYIEGYYPRRRQPGALVWAALLFSWALWAHVARHADRGLGPRGGRPALGDLAREEADLFAFDQMTGCVYRTPGVPGSAGGPECLRYLVTSRGP